MTPEERAWNVVNEVCPQWWDVSPSMVKKFLEAMAVALREVVAEEREACAAFLEQQGRMLKTIYEDNRYQALISDLVKGLRAREEV